jgi:hypothetical protein
MGASMDDVAYVAVVYLASVFSVITAGSMSRRLGPVRFMQIALLVSAAGVALLAAGHIVAAIIAAVLFGLAAGPVMVSSSQILARGPSAVRLCRGRRAALGRQPRGHRRPHRLGRADRCAVATLCGTSRLGRGHGAVRYGCGFGRTALAALARLYDCHRDGRQRCWLERRLHLRMRAPAGRAGEFVGAATFFVFLGSVLWPTLFRQLPFSRSPIRWAMR